MLNNISFVLLFICLLLFNSAFASGKATYQRYCSACHDVGTANAPLISDKTYWQQRLKQAGSSSLLTHRVITGKNAMPPKGGCTNCSEDTLRKAVEFMLDGPSKQPQAVKNPHWINQLQLPLGFKIALYADNVPGARQMTLGDNGIVYVGTRDQGAVYALVPNETGTSAMKTIPLMHNLNHPNGVAYKDGALYIAEINRIIKLDNITSKLSHPPSATVVTNQLPNKAWHGYRYIKFSPDNWLYVSVGMPCNTCNYRNKEPKFGTIMRLKHNGKDLQIYAQGVRNSVGFDWQPESGSLWFSDNGQDLLGDNYPPDEINRAPRPGMDFGFPYYIANNQLAPGYEKPGPAIKHLSKPQYLLPAHVAPLGMMFYDKNQFPASYKHQMFLAEHGSWNRTKKVGYQVLIVRITEGHVKSAQTFIKGWLQGQTVLGRPVDIITLSDGSILISDDLNGFIYRVWYQGTPNKP